MKLALLIHVLAMAGLIGAIVPVGALRSQFRKSDRAVAKAALVLTAIRMRAAAAALLVVVVASGAFLTMAGGYSWFDFSAAFWLAFKQLVGILLLGDALAALRKLRLGRAAIAAAGSDERALEPLVAGFPKAAARAQITIAVGIVLACLGVLKPMF